MPTVNEIITNWVQGLGNLQKRTDRGVDIEFRWIRAHSDIWGNEAVNQLAKEAATVTQRGSLEHDTRHDRSIWLAAAAKRRIRPMQERNGSWLGPGPAPSGAPGRSMKSSRSRCFEYWSSQRKATASIMIQLRTGKIGLAAYLAKINTRESGRCACGLGRETIEHVLMECDRWEDERHDLRFDIFEGDVSMLLGCDELLTHRDAARPVACFMMRTGLLGQFREVDDTATVLRDLEEGDSNGFSKGSTAGPVAAHQRNQITMHQGQGDCEISGCGQRFLATSKLTPLILNELG